MKDPAAPFAGIGSNPPGQFAPTRWTLVLRACGRSADSQSALSELCEAYYKPVLAFIRCGGRPEESARDLTQEFFRRLLSRQGLGEVDPERGRFRSYLLGAVKHFLAEQRQHANAAKRGGGQVAQSIETGGGGETTTELQVPDPEAVTPDAFFDRHWAATLVDRAVAALAAEFHASGKTEQFKVLKPSILGDLAPGSQNQAAARLGLSDGAVRVAVHRMRKRFREIIKAEIAQTLDNPARVQEELQYLVEVLARSDLPRAAD